MGEYKHTDLELSKSEFDLWLSEQDFGNLVLDIDARQLMLIAFRGGFDSGYEEGMWDHMSG